MKSPAWTEIPTLGAFDLAQTLDSGQAFHWEAAEWQGRAGFAGCIGGQAVWLAQTGPETVAAAGSAADAAARYLGIDQPLSRIHRSFPPDDAVLAEAIAWCPGLRVLRQPLWECLATFMTSPLKQVAHIRQISLALRRRYGETLEAAGRTVHAYPAPEALARAGESALRACGLGYRAAGLHRAAAAFAAGQVDPAELDGLDDEGARAWLKRFHGVGDKVANCVLLFGLGRHGAFPIDVWMDRVLRERYFGPRRRKRITPAALQAWAEEHFGPCGGYAQQYLFHFARKTL